MPVITKYINFTQTFGPLKYTNLKYEAKVTPPAKEEIKGWETMENATLEANQEVEASTVIKVGVESFDYSPLDNYHDILASFSKLSVWNPKKMETENYSSGFTIGASFGCEHGSYLVSFGTQPVCTKPPKQAAKVQYSTSYTGVRSKVPAWQQKNIARSWNPFDHSTISKKNISGFETYKRYDIKSSAQGKDSCFKDQLADSVASKA